MDGLFDKFGRPKAKARSAQSTPSPKGRSVKRMLSIKPKASGKFLYFIMSLLCWLHTRYSIPKTNCYK